jgi:hypothetical protein
MEREGMSRLKAFLHNDEMKDTPEVIPERSLPVSWAV